MGTTALSGLAPRAMAAAWAVFGLCLVDGVLGDVLDLRDRLLDVSRSGISPGSRPIT